MPPMVTLAGLNHPSPRGALTPLPSVLLARPDKPVFLRTIERISNEINTLQNYTSYKVKITITISPWAGCRAQMRR
jgi:hypothetical protein